MLDILIAIGLFTFITVSKHKASAVSTGTATFPPYHTPYQPAQPAGSTPTTPTTTTTTPYTPTNSPPTFGSKKHRKEKQVKTPPTGYGQGFGMQVQQRRCVLPYCCSHMFSHLSTSVYVSNRGPSLELCAGHDSIDYIDSNPTTTCTTPFGGFYDKAESPKTWLMDTPRFSFPRTPPLQLAMAKKGAHDAPCCCSHLVTISHLSTSVHICNREPDLELCAGPRHNSYARFFDEGETPENWLVPTPAPAGTPDHSILDLIAWGFDWWENKTPDIWLVTAPPQCAKQPSTPPTAQLRSRGNLCPDSKERHARLAVPTVPAAC